MIRIYGERATNLRKVLDATPNEALKAQDLYERMGITAVGQAEERKNVRNTLPALVRCGFVLKTGSGPDATYQSSGKAKKRRQAPDAKKGARKGERNALAAAAKLVRTRAARVEMQAANTPAQAKAKPMPAVETVDQFLARGGRVQRLAANWEQMERAA
jgi:hypothetical protein